MSSPVADPDYFISDENWERKFGQAASASIPSYIYLRGANLGQATKGELYLYYTAPSLILWPSAWSKNLLQTSRGNPSYDFSVAAGARLVTQDPFLWIPEPIQGDQYSLIGCVVTPKHPNPIPEDGSITSFAKYISDHPDMAWRNEVTADPSSPVISRTVEYSQGDRGAETIILITAEHAPVGSLVSFSAGTPGPNPPLVLDPVTISNNIKFSAGVTSYIPAQYSTLLTYSWYSNGKTPLPGMTFVLSAYIPVNSSSELYDRARDLRELGVPAEVIGACGGMGPLRAICLGTDTMVFP